MFYKGIRIGKNKASELQIDIIDDNKWSDCDFEISLSRKTDHAGFTFNFTIKKFRFLFSIYDTRHWNEDTDSWEAYPQDQAQFEGKSAKEEREHIDMLIKSATKKLD